MTRSWRGVAAEVGVVTKRFGSLNKSILLVVSLLMTGLLHALGIETGCCLGQGNWGSIQKDDHMSLID